ncbi:MAG: hypothetical protein KJ734_14375, partial [Chloroflexi bacterium]|nr:hypothetical protein [Chloroflexota bacterium]
MSGTIKTIFWAILAIVVVMVVLLFVLPRLGGGDGVPASATCFRDALPASETFVYLSGPLKVESGEPSTWVIFFRDNEGPYASFVQGAIYRAEPFSDRLPPAFLLWQLGPGPAPINLGETTCRAEGRDVLATSKQIDPTEIVIWGYAAAQQRPTRLHLFYRASPDGKDISQLYYEHYRSYIGERGVYFLVDAPQTLVVQRTITWAVGGETQTLAQTDLCRQEQYTP